MASLGSLRPTPCAFIGLCMLMCVPGVQAAGAFEGNCWIEQVKGRPGAYVALYEWNIYALIDGGTTAGHFDRVGDVPQSSFNLPNPQIPWGLPAGNYSLLLDQPLFWGRPKVVTNKTMPANGVNAFNVELATDYSCAFGNNSGIWGTDPWDWDSTWYQTFKATGTSISGISYKLAGTTANDVLISVVQNNGGSVTTWPQVGASRSRPASGNNDTWVRFRSGEIPTTPGQTYAIKLQGVGGGGGLGIYRRMDGGNGYADGQAFSGSGSPRNYDLYVIVLSDNDGTVIPYCSRLSDGGSITHWANTWSQQILAKGNGLAGAVIYFAAETWNITLDFSVHTGSPFGPQVGPTKTGHGASQASGSGFAGASWNPGEVALTPGQVYYMRVSGGLNPYRFTNGENAYAPGDAYAESSQQPGTDLLMQVVEYANASPPTISAVPSVFNRNVIRGQNLSGDTFTLSNTGGSVLNYTITDNASWLSASPSSGAVASVPVNIAINYSTAGLATGPYTGVMTITAPGATNTPRTVTVNLTVNPPPYARSDFDQDTDVDLDDYGELQRCMTGDGFTITDPTCLDADLTGDDDVDSGDFTKFLACLSGARVPVIDTTCDD